MLGLPTFSEVIILFISMILYILPGYFMVHLFFPKLDKFSEKLVIGFSIIIIICIWIGFILSNYKFLNSFISILILIFIYIFCMLVYIIERPSLFHKIRNKYKNLMVFLCLVSIFFIAFLIFYVWEGLLPGIGAWDRGEHHVRLLYLYFHEKLPTTEIGTIVNPFYPEGFNLATFFFSSIPMFTSYFEIANLDKIITFFMATILGLITVTIYSVSMLYQKNKIAAIFASLSFIIIVFHFIFHSMPSSLALILVGALLILFKRYMNNDLPFSYMVLSIFLLSTILMIHPIMFFYSTLIIFPLLILWRKNKEITKRKFYLMVGIVVCSLIFYTIFMFIFKPELLFGTFNYLGIRGEGSISASGVENPFSILCGIFKFRYNELIFYFSTTLILLPFFIIGLLYNYQKSDALLILIVSIFLSITSIVWYSQRTPFFIFYPFTIFCGLGIVRVAKFFISNKSKWISIFLISILTSSIVLIGVNNALMGKSTHDSYAWSKEWRLKSYITQEEFDLCEWINNIGVKNRIIATPNDGPNFQMIESLTNNKILMASNFGAPQSFIDIRKIFLENMSKKEKIQTISKYNVSILLTNRERTVENLTNQLSVCEVYHPTPSYWVIILGDKNENTTDK